MNSGCLNAVWLKRAVPTWLLSCALGCGAGSVPQVNEPTGPVTLERYYPMEQRNAWSFDVDTQTGVPSLLVFQVLERAGDLATIGDPRRNPESVDRHYEIRPDGIFNLDAGHYLIREPLDVGQTWPTTNGRMARIVATDVHVEVPGGVFDHCLQIDESEGNAERSISTTYCVDVGPVIIETVQEMSLSGNITVRGELLGFTPASEAIEAEADQVETLSTPEGH